MTMQELNTTHQSTTPVLRAGHWTLDAGRALTLRPMTAGIMRIAQGRAWATFDGPHHGPLNDLGDRVVVAGGQLQVRAGQRVVIEAWRGEAPLAFSWDPSYLPALATAPQAAPRMQGTSNVLQPLADLRLALVFGTAAAGRLVAGLAGLALARLIGRTRPALDDCALSAQSRACRAHGAIS